MNAQHFLLIALIICPAFSQVRQAVREDGSSAPAHYWRGMAQYELGAYRKAVSSFKRSVELDENWASPI